MKYSLVFLLVLGLTGSLNSSPIHTRSLEDDLDDFLELLPIEDILPVVQEYLENDEEVKHAVEYVKSENFKKLLQEVESIEDVVEFFKYLDESGLRVFELIDKLHEAIGLPPLRPVKRATITGGMAGLVGDIKGILPLEEIKALYYEKLETSKDFKNLVDRLSSPKLQALVDKLAANKEVQHIVETLKEHGVHVQAFFDLVAKIFGIKFPEHRIFRSARSLADDLDDFLGLLPVEDILPLVQEYLENDEEVKHAVEYVKSENFKKLLQEIESIDDVVEFLKYLEESGLEVIELIEKLHEAIGLPPMRPVERATITGGMAGLVGDIKGLLPLEEIKALYYEKLETSVDFKNLVDRLSSPKLQALVDKLAANKEVQHIVETLKEHGVHVQAFFDLLAKIFGIKFPEHKIFRSARSLADDFEDFLALVPQDKILPIVADYMENDAEVQHVFEYIQSEDFKKLVTEVESIEDVLAFYDYLQESGLDVYDAVNQLHEAMGLPPLNHKVMRRSLSKDLKRRTGGVKGLIEDIKAVLPLDKFKDLYHEKMVSSPEFKELVERLRSPKLQAIVDRLFQNEVFLHIIETAKGHGIHVDAVADLLSTIFGLKFPGHRQLFNARGLEDDLADFVALIPKEEALELLYQYLDQDKEVQEVLEYVESAEFRTLVKMVENIDDVINFYDYLQESGLDVYAAVNALHELIGLPPLHHKRSVSRITGGVNGLIQDLKAILPIDKIKALYHEKLETSPEFKHLVERLHSPKFQAVVDTLLANEEFQEILNFAKAAGINVQAVADLLSKLFGLEFPEHNRKVRSAEHNIESDLEDFLDIMPIDKIAKIGIIYLSEDSEVQNAAKFIRTEEFKNLLVELQKEPEIAEFLEYFLESGLDVYTFLDLLNDFLGVPHFPRPVFRTLPGSPGVQGMLNAIRAVLPYDEIHALYEDKLVNSPDFKYFIERFKAPEFQSIVDRLSVNEKFIELGHQAYLHGIEIRHITDFLAELFGIKFPDVPFPPVDSRYIRAQSELMDDLTEFLDLLPIDQLTKVILSYFFHDKETQEAIDYARSEEFKDIVRELDRIPEYLEILEALDAAGLDIYHFIQVIHKFIGLDDKHPFLVRGAEVIGEPGIAGLIAELKKLLPDQQIKDLYYQKLESSKAFADFVELVKSDKFQTVTNTLFANKDFQHLLHDAKSHGVDLQAISDFFARVFGITTPPGVIDS
uniref:Protein G12 n=1 Tax=Bracon brevicornis TaxID=1563983 RepID=A0A6V7I5S7_9HYME